MKKILLATTIALCVSQWAFAAGVMSEAFDYYTEVKENNPETAAMRVVEALNKYTKEKGTIDQLLEDPEISPEFGSDSPLLLMNFKVFMQEAKAKGYGSGRFKNWNFRWVRGGCSSKEIIFYSPVKHGSKTVLFGFRESIGSSIVTPQEINANKLKPNCPD